MSVFDDHYGVENQRKMSFEAGRAIGLFEAALYILDNRGLDIRAPFHVARMLYWRAMVPLNHFPEIVAAADDPQEAEGEANATDVAKLRDDLNRELHRCLLDYGDHFMAG
jgi:hypothetical protein